MGKDESDVKPGNSFVGTLVNGRIASVIATNWATGIKIQNTSAMLG
jgi:hypothetical protein